MKTMNQQSVKRTQILPEKMSPSSTRTLLALPVPRCDLADSQGKNAYGSSSLVMHHCDALVQECSRLQKLPRYHVASWDAQFTLSNVSSSVRRLRRSRPNTND